MTDKPMTDHRSVLVSIEEGIHLHTAVVSIKLAADEYGVVQLVRPDGDVVARNRQHYGTGGTFDLSLSAFSTDKELEVQVFCGKVAPWYPFASPIAFIRDEIRHRLSWLYRLDDDDDDPWWDYDDD